MTPLPATMRKFRGAVNPVPDFLVTLWYDTIDRHNNEWSSFERMLIDCQWDVKGWERG